MRSTVERILNAILIAYWLPEVIMRATVERTYLYGPFSHKSYNVKLSVNVRKNIYVYKNGLTPCTYT